MKKKILVTGSSGFIAPHIIEECLLKGWKVVAIDKKKPNIIYHFPAKSIQFIIFGSFWH